MKRIVIAGGSKTGKSTMADTYNCQVKHTDDLMHLDWSTASEGAAKWFDELGEWIVEGVAVPRALRKWMKANSGKPCSKAIWLEQAYVERSAGQETMAKGCKTVWLEILEELRARGVEIEYPTGR
jgi:hypothetical protein